MIWLLALGLSYAGMAALCLAMNRHYRQVTNRLPGRRRQLLLRSLGWMTLALALILCIDAWGVSIGTVAWFGMLTLGTLPLVVGLPWAARACMLAGAVIFLPSVVGSLTLLVA